MPEDHKAGLGFPHDPPRASHRTLATHTFRVVVSLLETANLPAAILPPQPEQGLLNHLQAAVLPRAASGFYRLPS